MIKKFDFIEMNFTGKIKETNQIFDTTVSEDAKKIGLENPKPAKICVGKEMIVKGFDEALEGKEPGKSYSVEIEPKKAFGLRKPNLVKTIPMAVFLEKNINPYPGLMLNIDNVLVKISAVSGGRVITDFNSPLAGKTIIYDFKIIRKIESKEEKIKVLAEYFLDEKSEVVMEGNNVVVSFKNKNSNKDEFQKIAKELDIEVILKEKK